MQTGFWLEKQTSSCLTPSPASQPMDKKSREQHPMYQNPSERGAFLVSIILAGGLDVQQPEVDLWPWGCEENQDYELALTWYKEGQKYCMHDCVGIQRKLDSLPFSQADEWETWLCMDGSWGGAVLFLERRSPKLRQTSDASFKFKSIKTYFFHNGNVVNVCIEVGVYTTTLHTHTQVCPHVNRHEPTHTEEGTHTHTNTVNYSLHIQQTVFPN